MRAVIMMSEGIEKLVKNKKISQEEIQNILTRFGKNDWGELNEDDKEEQDRMLIEILNLMKFLLVYILLIIFSFGLRVNMIIIKKNWVLR